MRWCADSSVGPADAGPGIAWFGADLEPDFGGFEFAISIMFQISVSSLRDSVLSTVLTRDLRPFDFAQGRLRANEYRPFGAPFQKPEGNKVGQ